MGITLLLKGVLLGVINAAPIGPVGLLCLQKNVTSDRWHGLFSALGMAVAYAIIAFCVLFGLKAIGHLLEEYRVVLQIAGGLLLIFMGWRGFWSEAKDLNKGEKVGRYLTDFSSSFAMTLFNPVPFASFTVILTTFKVVTGHLDLISDIHFALCVFTGTIAFWVIVNHILHHVRKHSPGTWCHWIGKGASIAMLCFGLAILVSAAF